MIRAILAATLLSTTAYAQPPNVIVILGDDVGYADVGFHDEVAPGVHTPHLDALAAGGAVFRNAYAASPVCSNSRLALITGRYGQRWGAYYYGQGGMPNEETSIAEMMREAGYRTMKVGKTHLNGGPKELPTRQGFDQSLGFLHHSWDYFLLSEDDAAAYENKLKGSVKQTQRGAPLGPLTRDDTTPVSFENTTTTEVFGRESVRFIEQESDRPFYLQLEFNAVHTPLVRAPKHLLKKYGIPERPFDRDAEEWAFPIWDPARQPDFKTWYDQTCHLGVADPYGRAIYLAHLELMDAAIGEIVTALERRGMRDNTLIVFSSDNGGSNQSYANNGGLNAFKYCLMDGGIKVPMVVSWPDRIAADTRIDATVTHRDVFPSLAEITGVAPQNPLDGQSLLPLLDGSTQHLDRGPLFWDCGNKNRDTWITLQDHWKLVYRDRPRNYLVYELDGDGLVKPDFRKVPIPGGMQLYNLLEDPGEATNLAQQHPDRVAEMKRLRDDWRATMADPVRGKSNR